MVIRFEPFAHNLGKLHANRAVAFLGKPFNGGLHFGCALEGEKGVFFHELNYTCLLNRFNMQYS